MADKPWAYLISNSFYEWAYTRVGLSAGGLVLGFKKNVSETGGPIREWAYPRVGLSAEFYGMVISILLGFVIRYFKNVTDCLHYKTATTEYAVSKSCVALSFRSFLVVDVILSVSYFLKALYIRFLINGFLI